MQRTESTLFDRWLWSACIAFGLLGLLWVLLGSFDPFGIWDGLLARAFFDGATPAEVVRFRRFILGPMGATNAAYFFALALIVRVPFRRREPWAFAAVGGTLCVWFAVDSAASLFHGALFNVLLVNLPCAVLLGVPLLALWPQFRAAHGSPSR